MDEENEKNSMGNSSNSNSLTKSPNQNGAFFDAIKIPEKSKILLDTNLDRLYINEVPNKRNFEDSLFRNKKKRKTAHIKELDQLDIKTREAFKKEEDRKMRVESLKALKQNINIQLNGLYLDIDITTNQPILKVDSILEKVLYKHQIEGIQFMWISCFENVERIKEGDQGSGCILSHLMGLGKTLQTITLIHTLLVNYKMTNVKRVLVLVPVNIFKNWIQEFEKWTSECENKIKVYECSVTKTEEFKDHYKKLIEWQRGVDGVIVMTYSFFSKLMKFSSTHTILTLNTDLLICDEGHKLKNNQTKLYSDVQKIKTLRKIILSGTPIQNNLMECYHMVSLIKPDLLGNEEEFRNRFANPINQGQIKEASEEEVNIMKKQAFVLNQQLGSFIDRKEIGCIKDSLPLKYEYVFRVKLSEMQENIYKMLADYFLSSPYNFSILDNISDIISNQNKKKSNDKFEKIFFSRYRKLSSICAHPWVFKSRYSKNIDQKIIFTKSENIETNIEDRDTSDIDYDKDYKNDETLQHYNQVQIDDTCRYNMSLSGKIFLLLQIINFCKQLGEKLVVFSESRVILDYIEEYLNENYNYRRNKNYFRIDGHTEAEDRQTYINNFNNTKNKINLFLITTKAGGIGINLVGANRCVIFDPCWNPTDDLQAIYRIYRLGQKKDVFIYRFIAKGTIEDVIYKKQVFKESLSKRVVDDQQLKRHYNIEELKEYYQYTPSCIAEENKLSKINDEILDKILNCIDLKGWIVSYHEHESLLKDNPFESLDENERKIAIEAYKREFTEEFEVN